ncbi:hypothetical protein HOP38_02695 [Vibrio mediterranei]|uniref:hypothetical protein n=1 Tax=Vibrio mediterranei TaxID=689 RepID=UPI00183A2265|nr:hypothetical protein [Vibrio mediterranei]NUW71419.1 hypothetical protein [Vibrio mediterranei]
MTIENAQYINQLDESLPTSKADVGEDDDHLRLVKTVLKSSFPEFDTPVTLTEKNINKLPTKLSDLTSEKGNVSDEKNEGIQGANEKKDQVLAYVWDDLSLEKNLASGGYYALFYEAGGAFTLPSEWVKCDGTNGTEDLTSKAIELIGGSQAVDSMPINYFAGLFVVKYVG